MANDEVLIELWDGKRYGAKQLEETYPAVVSHARLHAILHEEIDLIKFESKQHRKPVSVRAACLAFCLLNLGVVILSALAGVETSVIVAVASGVAMVSLLLLQVVVAESPAKAVPRSLSVASNLITVTTSLRADNYSLEDCCWFEGDLRDDPALSGSLVKGSAIILVVSTGEQFACGWDDEYRKVWKEFFEVISLRRVLPNGNFVGCALPLAELVSSIAAGAAGWYGTRGAIALLPQELQVHVLHWLPASICVFSSWFVFIGVRLTIPGWYRRTATERQSLYRYSVLLPWIVLGGGRRGLGLGPAGFVELLTLALSFSMILWWLCRSALRAADRTN